MNQCESVHRRLISHPVLFGLLQTQPNQTFCELAGMCGYDFLFLDGEHGLFSERDFLHAAQILSGVDVLAMVRLPNHDLQAVGRYLDMGVDAIVVPNVSTVDQAHMLVRAMRYPPSGVRGFGAAAHRVTRYGIDVVEHMKCPTAGASLIVMIESEVGVSNAKKIATVDGVTGLFIGPSDLSTDLGCPGDFAQPMYAEAISIVERAASTAGKLLGTVPHPGYSVDALVARGYRLVLLDSDMSLVRKAMRANVEEAQSRLRLEGLDSR